MYKLHFLNSLFGILACILKKITLLVRTKFRDIDAAPQNEWRKQSRSSLKWKKEIIKRRRNDGEEYSNSWGWHEITNQTMTYLTKMIK